MPVMTAAELFAANATDPAYQAHRAALDADLAAREQLLRAEQEPLLRDLALVGVSVPSVWSIDKAAVNYADAIPVLLKHLERPYDGGTRHGIAQALATKAAHPLAWPALLKLVRNDVLPLRVREGLMAAVSAMAKPTDLPILIALIEDRTIGSSRVFLVANLMRSRQPVARSTLLRLRDDPELCKEIARRLKAAPQG